MITAFPLLADYRLAICNCWLVCEPWGVCSSGGPSRPAVCVCVECGGMWLMSEGVLPSGQLAISHWPSTFTGARLPQCWWSTAMPICPLFSSSDTFTPPFLPPHPLFAAQILPNACRTGVRSVFGISCFCRFMHEMICLLGNVFPCIHERRPIIQSIPEPWKWKWAQINILKYAVRDVLKLNKWVIHLFQIFTKISLVVFLLKYRF